jgi:hypothetical protein
VLRSIKCQEQTMRDPAFFQFHTCTLQGFLSDGSLPWSMSDESLAGKMWATMHDLSSDNPSLKIKESTEGVGDGTESVFTIADTTAKFSCRSGSAATLAVQQYSCKYEKITTAPPPGALGLPRLP